MAITLQQAEDLVRRGRERAEAIGVNAVFAVLDAGANLVCFARMDRAWLGSNDLALGKARTSVMFQAPSGAFSAPLELGKAVPHFDHTSGGLVLIAGGLPVRDGDELIGAVGVSGGTAEQDAEIAEACLGG